MRWGLILAILVVGCDNAVAPSQDLPDLAAPVTPSPSPTPAPTPSPSPSSTSSPSPSPTPSPSPCPDDMASIDNFCMDHYEAPNVAGAKPLAMQTAPDGEAWCNARG